MPFQIHGVRPDITSDITIPQVQKGYNSIQGNSENYFGPAVRTNNILVDIDTTVNCEPAPLESPTLITVDINPLVPSASGSESVMDADHNFTHPNKGVQSYNRFPVDFNNRDQLQDVNTQIPCDKSEKAMMQVDVLDTSC